MCWSVVTLFQCFQLARSDGASLANACQQSESLLFSTSPAWGHLAGTAGGWSILVCTNSPLLSQATHWSQTRFNSYLVQTLMNSLAGLGSSSAQSAVKLAATKLSSPVRVLGPSGRSLRCSLTVKYFGPGGWSRRWTETVGARGLAVLSLLC